MTERHWIRSPRTAHAPGSTTVASTFGLARITPQEARHARMWRPRRELALVLVLPPPGSAQRVYGGAASTAARWGWGGGPHRCSR